MTYFKTFDEYEDVNESAVHNIVAGLALLLGVSSAAKADVPDTLRKTTHKERTALSYEHSGWSIDSVHIDTLYDKYKKDKDSLVIYQAKFDDNLNFDLGKYQLTDSQKVIIDSLKGQILEDGNILVRVNVESSTDKTPIGKDGSLYKEGIKTNKDLSEARNKAVTDYLKTDINDSLITVEIKYEQGKDGGNDSAARYVIITFITMKPEIKTPTKPPTIKETYYLSKVKHHHKDDIQKAGKNVKSHTKKAFKMPFDKKWKAKQIKCPKF